jgi:lambda family phage tail tape measure protein
MASRQTTDITLRLNIDGFENLDSVKSAFRELQRVTQASEKDVSLAREAILSFSDATNASKRTIDAQVAGLRTLQSQASLNSQLYKKLGADIEGLKSQFTDTTAAIAKQTTVLDKQGSRVFGSSVDAIKRYMGSLRQTQAELTSTSRRLNIASTDVDKLNQQLRQTQSFKVNIDDTQLTGLRGKIVSTIGLFKKLGEQSRTPVGAVGRISEGVAATALSAPLAKAAVGAAGLGLGAYTGVGERLTALQDFLNTASRFTGGNLGEKVLGTLPQKIAEQATGLSGLQQKFDSLSGVLNSFTSALSSIDPKVAVATGSIITAFAFVKQRVSDDMTALQKDIEQSFTGISDDVQKLLVELRRLDAFIGKMSLAEISQQLGRAREAFSNVPAGSPRSRSFASQIAGLENVQRTETLAQADVLEKYRARVRGSSASAEDLTARLRYLQQALQNVDQSTSEGSAAHARYSNEIVSLESKLNKLAAAYTHVSDSAFAARTSQANPANTTTINNYLNRAGAVRAEQDRTYQQTQEALTSLNTAYDAFEEATRRHEATHTQIQVNAQRHRQEELDQLHREALASDEAAFKRQLAQFDAAVQHRDKIARRRSLMGQALGLGPQDLSPFYQRVVGLSSAALERQQMFMGKSPTDVYNDIVDSFRTGEKTDLLSGVREAATNVTDTLSDGLEQGSPKAKSAAEKLAEAAKAGIKRAFGIASPSKFIINVVQILVKTWEDELKSASPRLQLAAERAFGLSGPRRMTSRFVDTIEGKQIVPATNYRALPVRSLDVTAQGPEMDAMMRRYRQQIAALTTQPAIYENLLNALPSSRLTTNLAGMASRREGMSRLFSDYIPELRRREALGGPRPAVGEGVDTFYLENEIKRLASSYFREIRVPNPWVGVIGDYKKFIDAIEFDTKQLRTQALLSGTRIAGALPPVAESIGGLRQQRIAEAYRRSSERGLRVLAADAFADQGPLALPPTNYGFAADPARINRLMARGRRGRLSLPGAIDIQATSVVEDTAVAAESASLRATVKDFFARLRASVGSAFGGGAGGQPPTPPAGAGRGGPGDLGPEFNNLNAKLRDFGPLAHRSIADLQDLRSVLQGQQGAMAPGAAGTAMRREYDQVIRAIEEQDQRIEREIERRNRSRRRGPGARQVTQIAGAAISGGIFGGPEGFLGGVIGGAFGGVGGSFAGAAAGAQIGMLRQQLAGTSAYAAEIGKMQIALRGVSGTQQNYNQAIQAAARLTNELNIPQREATAGITRLGAAVLGAGGTMNDATFAFRSITEAIKATGGNAEQVDGALLALTQVFSKGKVSAEELNQIAERLPGTFTLFAKATGKTGPELQKALQQGQVGLNDLMKFLELASAKNAKTALDMSKSSEDAGARMTRAFEKMALDVGAVLQPIGAEFQNLFADFAKQATPGLVEATKGVGEFLKVLIDNGAAISAIAKLALQLGAGVLAAQALAAVAGPLKFAFDLIKISMTDMKLALGVAKLEMQAFAITAKAAAASLAAPLIITVAIVGADLVIEYFDKIKKARDGLTKVKSQATGEQWLREIGGAALTRERLTAAADVVGKRYQTVQDSISELEEKVRVRQEAARVSPRSVGTTSAQLIPIEEELTKLRAEAALLEGRYRAAIARIPYAPTSRAAQGAFPPPAASAADEAKQARDKAAADAQRLLEENARAEGAYNVKIFEDGVALDRKRYELRKQLLDEEQQNELARLQGTARTTAQAIFAYRNRLAEIDRSSAEARQAIDVERLRASSAQLVARIGNAMQGVYRQGNIGPTSTGAHFDIKQAGGGRFARTDLDRYVQVNGRPLSAGITVPGGTYDAPRPGRARHGGIDYAFPGSPALELKGGAQWIKLDPGTANGDVASFKLLDGRVFTILHGRFERTPGAPGATRPGSGAADRREVTQKSRADLSAAAVKAAEDEYEALKKVEEQQQRNARETLSNALTQSLRDTNYELENTLALETERQRLLASGASKDYIDQQMKLVELTRSQAEATAALREYFPDFAEQATRIAEVNAAYDQQRRTLEAIYTLNQANATTFGFREGAQRYVESVGTMRDATAQLTEGGFKGLEDVLVQLTTTGTANFQEFAASILQQSARMIMQLLIQKTIMQIIGAIGGGGNAGGGLGNFGLSLPSLSGVSPGPSSWGSLGNYGLSLSGGFPGMPAFGSANGNVFAANGIVPYAMGGVVNRPTYFPFANGGAIGTGLMGEAGPEAIMPLSRGANGKLGVMAAGTGTTNIVVNVDASGGTSVSGDAERGKQLGQVITAAVQAELIKQKRPGGLLS